MRTVRSHTDAFSVVESALTDGILKSIGGNEGCLVSELDNDSVDGKPIDVVDGSLLDEVIFLINPPSPILFINVAIVFVLGSDSHAATVRWGNIPDNRECSKGGSIVVNARELPVLSPLYKDLQRFEIYRTPTGSLHVKGSIRSCAFYLGPVRYPKSPRLIQT